jgi:hypothetical protein
MLWKIKPMDWKERGGHEYHAATPFRTIEIMKSGRHWRIVGGQMFMSGREDGYPSGEQFVNAAAAKARAEQWYTERLKEALEPATEDDMHAHIRQAQDCA